MVLSAHAYYPQIQLKLGVPSIFVTFLLLREFFNPTKLQIGEMATFLTTPMYIQCLVFLNKFIQEGLQFLFLINVLIYFLKEQIPLGPSRF